MDSCETFRHLFDLHEGASPAPDDAELMSHLASCAACAHYARVVRESQRLLIGRAAAAMTKSDWNAVDRALRRRGRWGWFVSGVLMALTLPAVLLIGVGEGVAMAMFAGLAAACGGIAMLVLARARARATARLAGTVDPLQVLRRELDARRRGNRATLVLAPIFIACVIGAATENRVVLPGVLLGVPLLALWLAALLIERPRLVREAAGLGLEGIR